MLLDQCLADYPAEALVEQHAGALAVFRRDQQQAFETQFVEFRLRLFGTETVGLVDHDAA